MKTTSESGVEQTAFVAVEEKVFEYLSKDAANDLAGAIQRQYAAMTPRYTE